MILFDHFLKSIGKNPSLYYLRIHEGSYGNIETFYVERPGCKFGPYRDPSDPVKYQSGGFVKSDWNIIVENLKNDDISALDKARDDFKNVPQNVTVSNYAGQIRVTLKRDNIYKHINLNCDNQGTVYIVKGNKGLKYKGPKDVIARLEKEVQDSIKAKANRAAKKAEEFAKRPPSISKLILALIKERGFRTQEHDKYVKVLTKLGSINIFFSRDPIEISGNFGWLKSKFRLADPNNKPIENITNLLDKIKDFENHLKDNYV